MTSGVVLHKTPGRHRPIPDLPSRPRVHPISAGIRRSYPVGRQCFSRACVDEALVMTITTQEPLPEDVVARLMTTPCSNSKSVPAAVRFSRADLRTLTCHLKFEHPGLHSFRAEFSLDGGVTWLGDTVPDAWILVDPPQVDGLRIYTLIPTVSGTIADWTADLSRIHAMGFNGIHLLPITAMDQSESPYAARDLFAVDESYVTGSVNKDDSREAGLSEIDPFVAAAKALGIRLGFDLVLNHVGVDSDMARRAPDWIMPDPQQTDGLQRARYWAGQGWKTWDDLVLINYEHPSEAVRSEIWAYMTAYALFWAKFADVTGGFIRFDNLHSSNPDFIQSVTAAVQTEYPNVAILAEYFTDERTLLSTGPKWGLNLILATPWNSKFVPELRDYLKYIHRLSEHVRYFMPITSHDCGAPAQEFGTADSTVPRYVAAALIGTGATGIPQGVEFGESERINFIGRKRRLLHPDEPRFAPFIGRVNAILAEHPAFRRGGNCQFVDDVHPTIIAVFRQCSGPDTLGFLVVCNFETSSSQRITVDLASALGIGGPYPCRELLGDEEKTFPHSRLELLLPPCSAQVLMFPQAAPTAVQIDCKQTYPSAQRPGNQAP